MQENLTITAEQFSKRLVTLCMRGLVSIPKDQTDQHILLKSAAMFIRLTEPLAEKELTNRLQAWLDVVKAGKDLDRVLLRRWLVDFGYLTRDDLGSRYEATPAGSQAMLFEAAIESLDTAAILQTAREEMEQKKLTYLQKVKGA